MIRTTSLPSGIDVVTEAMPGSHSASIGFWVDAGSRDEDPAVAGASHFLEHLLFKGTAGRSARDIDDAIELGLDILSDIMWAPAFRPQEIEAERQVILEEILMHEDEPADLVHELFAEALYPGHPLGREVLGDRSTITAMTRDEIAGYFEALYRPQAIVVAAAGNIDHDQVVAGIESRFAGRAGDRPPRARPPLTPARSVIVSNRPTEQAHLVVGCRALARDDDDRFALSILNQTLGGGMSSRLFQEIREKRGLVYSVYSYRAAYVESGSLAVYAGTSPGRVEEVLDLIDRELDRLLDEDLTDRELRVAKGHVKGSL